MNNNECILQVLDSLGSEEVGCMMLAIRLKASCVVCVKYCGAQLLIKNKYCKKTSLFNF